MKFKAHAPRPIPARRKESELAAWWEATIAALCTAGALALLVTAHDKFERDSIGTNEAVAAIEPAVHVPDPFDGLPADTPEALAAAKAEALARFNEAWAPKSVATTRGGWSTELTDCGDECQRTYRQRWRHESHGAKHDKRHGLEYPRDHRDHNDKR